MYEISNPHVKFLYYLAKFCGLAPFELQDNSISCESWRDTMWSFGCSLILVSGIGIVTIETVKNVTTSGINLLILSDLTINYLTYVGALLCLITFVGKRERIVDIVRHFIKFNGASKPCGAELNKRRALLVAICSVVFIVTEYLTSLVFRYTSHIPVNTRGTYTELFAIKYCSFVFHYVIVIFVNVMLSIEYRIRILNESIASLSASPWEQRQGPRQRSLAALRCILSSPPDDTNMKSAVKFERIEEMHEELCDLADKTMQLFSFPLIIVNGIYCMRLIATLFFNFNTAVQMYVTEDLGPIPVFSTISISTLVMLLELFAVAFVCASLQKSVKSTAVMIHKMWIRHNTFELKDRRVLLVIKLELVSVNDGLLFDVSIGTSKGSGLLIVQEVQQRYGRCTESYNIMTERRNLYAIFLYYMAKVWGLAPFTLINNRAYLGSSFQVIYPITLATMCLPELIITVFEQKCIAYESETVMTHISDILSVYLGNLSSGLFVTTFLLNRRKIVGIMNALIKLDGPLRTLGVEQDCENYFKSRAITVGTLSFYVTITVYGIKIAYSLRNMDNFCTLWTSYSVIMGSWVSVIQYHGILAFLIAVDFVQKRYYQLNHLFSNVCADVDIQRARYVWNVAPAGTGETRICTNPVLRGDPDPLEMFRRIEELYDNLREFTDSLLEIFYLPITGTLAFYFTTILNILYYTYVGSTTIVNTYDYQHMLEMVGLICWVMPVLAGLFAIAVKCSSIQKTANFTTVILRRMWLKFHPVEMKDEAKYSAAILHKIWHQYPFLEVKDEIQMLSLQLLHRPLTISAFGFFSLDYSYLYKIFCAVVAYFIIMIQLDTSKLEPSHANSTLNGTHI